MQNCQKAFITQIHFMPSHQLSLRCRPKTWSETFRCQCLLYVACFELVWWVFGSVSAWCQEQTNHVPNDVRGTPPPTPPPTRAQWQNIAQICCFDWTWHTVLTFGKDNWLFNNSCQAVINHAKAAPSAAFAPLQSLRSVAKRQWSAVVYNCTNLRLRDYPVYHHPAVHCAAIDWCPAHCRHWLFPIIKYDL